MCIRVCMCVYTACLSPCPYYCGMASPHWRNGNSAQVSALQKGKPAHSAVRTSAGTRSGPFLSSRTLLNSAEWPHVRAGMLTHT